MVHGMTENVFSPGDKVRVTKESSSMYGAVGHVTHRLKEVPMGGWCGYRTTIEHPAGIPDGFGWFRPENLVLITRRDR